MPTKSSLPDPQNVADYPDNPKAVMVSARGVIRVVERLYYLNSRSVSCIF